MQFMANIQFDSADGIARLTINRPEKKNALTLAMYTELATALQEADADDKVRVILLSGAGDCFSAGNDLQDFLQNPPHDSDAPSLQFLDTVSTVRKPVVAAVNGLAIGIGTTMLLHCDLVYAADNARFHLPFVDLALVPEAGSSVLVPALVGYHRAAELLLLGKAFDAETAQKHGLVNEVVPVDLLAQRAGDVAAALAAKPPKALMLTKSLLKRGMADMVAAAMREEGKVFIERLKSSEARNVMQAFLAKPKK